MTDTTLEASQIQSTKIIHAHLQKLSILSTLIGIAPTPENPNTQEDPMTEPHSRIINQEEVHEWKQWSETTIPFIERILHSQGRYNIPHGKKGAWEKNPDTFTHQHKTTELDQTDIQKALSTKKNDGPLDGLYCDITKEWVATTHGIHKICERKINQMYEKHWFAKLSQSVLWKEEENNAMMRAELLPKEIFAGKLETAMMSLNMFASLLHNLHTEANPTTPSKKTNQSREEDIDKLTTISEALHLNTPIDLLDRLRHRKTTTADNSWLLERENESQNIMTIFKQYLEKIYDTLHNPSTPTQEAVDLFKWTLEKPTTAKEARKMFSSTKSGVVSGPMGINKGHLVYAPDHILEALLPIIGDMLEGNYPDCLKIGAIAPKPKDLHRFRPITLLEYLYRAVDSRVTKRLLEVIEKLKLVDPDQFGSIRGGSTAAAIDILRLVIEDSDFHQKSLWLTLLDCSEAFDSLDDVITDISFKSIGIPDFFTTWARQARRSQRRIIITAGGVSKVSEAIPVKGGSQGAPSMPAFWALASTLMILFAKKHGGEPYSVKPPQHRDKPSPHPGETLSQQTTYVDDNSAFARKKKDNHDTIQAIMVMQAVLNIRSQGAKSILYLSKATIDKLDDEVKNWWEGDQLPPKETNMKISPRQGREWVGSRESHQVTLTLKPNRKEKYSWTPPQPEQCQDSKRWSKPSEKWGITAKLQEQQHPQQQKLIVQTSVWPYACKEETIIGIKDESGKTLYPLSTPPSFLPSDWAAFEIALNVMPFMTLSTKRGTTTIHNNAVITKSRAQQKWGLNIDFEGNNIFIADLPSPHSVVGQQLTNIQKGDRISCIKGIYEHATIVNDEYICGIFDGTLCKKPPTMELLRNLPPWEATSKYRDTQYVTPRRAHRMAATHDVFSITVLTLDSSGHISKSEITTLLEEKDEKKKWVNESAKHLGVKISPLQGDAPQFANLVKQMHAATNHANNFTRGIREFTKAAAAVHGQLDYNLSAITPSSHIIDDLRNIITRGAFNSIGLSHKAKTADRNSIMALSSPLISLGFGIPDTGATLVMKAFRSVQKRLMSPHPGHRATLTVPLFDLLHRDGTLRKYEQEDGKFALCHTRQMFCQMKLLRDNLFVVHIGGGLPRQTLNPTPRLQELPTPIEAWAQIDSTKIKALANITFLPAPRIGYFLAHSKCTHPPRTGLDH